MHLLLTRPVDEAKASAVRLEALGHTVTLAPMLQIAVDTEVAIDSSGLGAIAVTSPRAVRALAERSDFLQILRLPLFGVGDRTAEVARDVGFLTVESAAGDVAALTSLIADRCKPVDGALLYACGRDRRGDLEGRLEADGSLVRTVEVYRADIVSELSKTVQQALADRQIEAVLIYSTRAGQAFVEVLIQAGLRDCLRWLTVFAISEAAAVPFENTIIRDIAIAACPNEASLLDLVAKIR